MNTPLNISIGPDHHLTHQEVDLVANNPNTRVVLSSAAVDAVQKARAEVDRLVAEMRPVYGLTTGFGKFKDKFINQKDTATLQSNLIRSHSAGVGEPLSIPHTRAMLLVRINSLALGYSGIRIETLNHAVELLNRNIIPVVPSQGSVGSSGDLAPLSHLGLALMGEGEVWHQGERTETHSVFAQTGLRPIAFAAKEGLAWNNGTSCMLGTIACTLTLAERLVANADGAAALTVEAVQGVTTAFDAKVHKVRPHPGQIETAATLRTLLDGSKLVNRDPKRIQDSYSIRCIPQVHGAVKDCIAYVRAVVDRELNSVTDNPLIFAHEHEVISGGNFHGEPLAIAADALGIALSCLGNISERRTAKLVDSATSEGLPLFLVAPERGGLENGLMIPQYVAAALVSENKTLAHPASVDSIPTSANQEDYVSMGSIATRKAWSIAVNVSNVLAIEYLTNTQAIEFRGKDLLGPATRRIYDMIRTTVPPIDFDRAFSGDIDAIAGMIRSGSLSTAITV